MKFRWPTQASLQHTLSARKYPEGPSKPNSQDDYAEVKTTNQFSAQIPFLVPTAKWESFQHQNIYNNGEGKAAGITKFQNNWQSKVLENRHQSATQLKKAHRNLLGINLLPKL